MITKLSEVYAFLYTWSDIVINNPQSIGTITVTKGSKLVAGTNFITNAIVQPDGYIRLSENYWAQIDTVDTEIQLTLKSNYRSVSGTATGYYSDIGMEIVIGDKNVSSSAQRYIVIHEPPISNRRIGDTQVNKNERVVLPDTSVVRRTTYTNTFQASISFEEVQGEDNLNELDQRISEDDILELWRAEKMTFMRMESAIGSNDETGNIIENRFIQDLVLMYTIEKTYDSYYIETVDYTGNYITGG